MLYTPNFNFRLRTQQQMQGIRTLSITAQQEFFGLEDDLSLTKELLRISNGQYTGFYAGRYFDIILKSENRVIGSGGFHTWWRDHDRAEIGYSLNHPEDRGKRYMTEILPFLIDYGFNEMRLHRIEAFTAQDNDASIALLQKFGFKQEALIHNRYKLMDGSYSDDFLFYLLNN